MFIFRLFTQMMQNLRKEKGLVVDPADYISFPRDEPCESSIIINNTTSIPITYKMQTTAQHKYCVRPRIGSIDPGRSVKVYIYLRSGTKISDQNRDKFLILSMPLEGDSEPESISEVWQGKSAKTPHIEHHRLIARYKTAPDSGPPPIKMTRLTSGHCNEHRIDFQPTTVSTWTQTIECVEI